MVVVALGEPSVPVTCWAAVGSDATRAEKKKTRVLAVFAIVMSLDSMFRLRPIATFN
jgi:hypothetical protein